MLGGVSSVNLKRLERSRNSSIEKLAFTSRASSHHQSALRDILERQQKGFKIKVRTLRLEQELQTKRKENAELTRNISTAMELAKTQRLDASRGKQQVQLISTINSRQSKEIQRLKTKIKEQEQQLARVIQQNQQLVEQCKQIDLKQEQLDKCQDHLTLRTKQNAQLIEDNRRLQLIAEDNGHLRDRIKALELTVREVKLANEECNAVVKRVTQEKKQLEEALRRTKPDAERQQERIRYYERVNLDLQRRMDQFNRRQNYLLSQIQKLTQDLNQTRTSRDNYKSKLQQTTQELVDKTAQCDDFRGKYLAKKKQSEQLTVSLEQAENMRAKADKQLRDTIDFYTEQARQNQRLIQRNKALQQNQQHIRNTLSHIKQVTHTVNLELGKRQAQIHNLKQNRQDLTQKIQELTALFQKFDFIYNQNTSKGRTQLKDTVNGIIKDYKKLQLDFLDLRQELEEKALAFGEERDALKRDIEVRKMVLVGDETCYQAIFAEKNEEMRVLENSNQQLLKLKASLQQTVEEVSKRIQAIQRQNDAFKIRILDLYKLTKQHQQLKQREQRYHKMLLESRADKDNLEEQMTVLREKNQQLYDQKFSMEMDCRTKALKIMDLERILQQLDVDTLQNKKTLLEKRQMVMNDAIDKFSNCIPSISMYFTCCLCSKLLKQPVTVHLCGHNYCFECERGYQDDCFECNTGLPIEKTFLNKYLANTITKYQFFLHLFEQVKSVFPKSK